MRKLSFFNGGVFAEVFDGTGERHRQDSNTAVSPEKMHEQQEVVRFYLGELLLRGDGEARRICMNWWATVLANGLIFVELE